MRDPRQFLEEKWLEELVDPLGMGRAGIPSVYLPPSTEQLLRQVLHPSELSAA